MITAIVRFRLPETVTRAKALDIFRGSAPAYRELPGLVRKYYLLGEDGLTAGGVYLWESRAAAEAVYDEAWRRTVTERYGSPPEVTFYESPVVVDNATGEILTD